jgi:hypothetical protein
MNQDKTIEILTTNGGNAYVAFYSTGLEELWTAPIKTDGSVDHDVWSLVEDDKFYDEFVRSEKQLVETISLGKFQSFIQ